ncbi:MAG: DUF86 domain-containing protein [Draconibacterium sp.]
MFDRDLTLDVVNLLINNLEIVLKRSANVKTPDEFTSTESGMMLLDSICMKLVAIGESIKNLDKVSNKELLVKYPQIEWKQAMGMRDIIVHHYFDVDAEQIFVTLKEDVPPLIDVLSLIKLDLESITD